MATAQRAAAQRNDRIELTLRGLILGGLITLVFTAANVYLGLKVGLTFASSIPAAVISMTVLRAFRSASIYENNIVQTVASAAGTLSSIIFVLPGLVMVGWWTDFPFWESFGICLVGGVLGVMYTVPLRRALVTQSDLPYPEGVAAAEVLRVGVGTREGAEEGRIGALAVVWGALVSGAFAAIAATRIFIGELDLYVRGGAMASGIGFSLSFALLGAGHLIGLSVGIAMFVGLVIAWGIFTPILTAMHPAAGSAMDVANAIWSHDVRFIGAGAIGVAAVWTLAKLALPVWSGLQSALAAAAHRAKPGAGELPIVERDIPIGTVAAVCAASVVPLAVLFVAFLHGHVPAATMVPLVAAAVLYTIVIGFLVAGVCGYMAGLIGSSNSPVSGLAILAVIGASLMVALIARGAGPAIDGALIAFALFVTAVVLNVATIANDNLQDLKTGQLVGATPWRQQTALIVGVLFGAAVIPPILDLLNAAYGFAGAPQPHTSAAAQPLPAPQATLISTLAKGVIGGHLDWSLIGVGAIVGAIVVVIDEVLRARTRFKLPPLAVGIGIYLPAATISTVVVGAVAGALYDRWVAGTRHAEAAKRMGVLAASGLIVGESLFGVILAAIIVFSKNGSPLALVGDAFTSASTWIGGFAFLAGMLAIYRWAGRLPERSLP